MGTYKFLNKVFEIAESILKYLHCCKQYKSHLESCIECFNLPLNVVPRLRNRSRLTQTLMPCNLAYNISLSVRYSWKFHPRFECKLS